MLATGDLDDLRRTTLGQLDKLTVDLMSQLPCRYQYQCLGKRMDPQGIELLKNRDRKRSGLASPGSSLTKNIVALKRMRDNTSLNRARFAPTDLG